LVVVSPPLRLDRLGDEALLAAVGVGDAEAATAFVRRFQRPVYGLALSITLDPSSAEEIAQQAFERAWRHAATYDARRGLVATWLLTITRNLAIDALRVRRPQPLDLELVDDLLPGSSAPDPAEAAVRADDLDRLRVALGDLPEEQRRAVLLATLGSRTSTEIAQLEGVPIPTAKHRVQTGLRKLRRAVRAGSEA
jgi:RNA polymerase sigma factor (sigma-70 family)